MSATCSVRGSRHSSGMLSYNFIQGGTPFPLHVKYIILLESCWSFVEFFTYCIPPLLPSCSVLGFCPTCVASPNCPEFAAPGMGFKNIFVMFAKSVAIV